MGSPFLPTPALLDGALVSTFSLKKVARRTEGSERDGPSHEAFYFTMKVFLKIQGNHPVE